MTAMTITPEERERMRRHAEGWLGGNAHHGNVAARNVLRLLDALEEAEKALRRIAHRDLREVLEPDSPTNGEIARQALEGTP